MSRNVILTTLSTSRARLKRAYYYRKENGIILFCDGISSVEPGAKYLLSSYDISDIIVVGSPETYHADNELTLRDLRSYMPAAGFPVSDDRLKKMSDLEFFEYRLSCFLRQSEEITPEQLISDLMREEDMREEELKRLVIDRMEQEGRNDPSEWFLILAQSDANAFLREISEDTKEREFIRSWLYSMLSPRSVLQPKDHSAPISLRFIPGIKQARGSEETVVNISGIIEALRGDEEDTNVYVDMQGGSRTDNYVRNAVLSILSEDTGVTIHLEKFVATAFRGENFVNEILDETHRYRIMDLVSGMNAFLHYGRADLIRRYYEQLVESDPHLTSPEIETMIDHMKDFSEALALCDIRKLDQALNNLREFFLSGEIESSSANATTEIFHILTDTIKREFSQLYNDDGINYSALIKWALAHRFVMQALTIIEARIPHELVRTGTLYYLSITDGQEERDRVKQLFMDWIEGKRRRQGGNLAISKARRKQTDYDHYYIRKMISCKPDTLIKKRESFVNARSNLAKEEYGRLKTLLSNYEEICQIRNRLCHVTNENDGIDIEKKIDSFLERYDSVMKSERLSSVTSLTFVYHKNGLIIEGVEKEPVSEEDPIIGKTVSFSVSKLKSVNGGINCRGSFTVENTSYYGTIPKNRVSDKLIQAISAHRQNTDASSSEQKPYTLKVKVIEIAPNNNQWYLLDPVKQTENPLK